MLIKNRKHITVTFLVILIGLAIYVLWDAFITDEPEAYINVSKHKLFILVIGTVIIIAFANSVLVSNYLKRKGTEKELSREKNILQAVLDSTRDGILVVNDKDNRILHTNCQFKKMWRIPKKLCSEMYDHKLIAYVKDQLLDPKDFEEKVREVGKTEVPFSDILKFRDGRIFERSFKPLLIEGVLRGRVWSFRDITQRTEFESELKKSEELYRKLVELLPDAVLVRKGRDIIIANENAFRILNEKRPDNKNKGPIKKNFKVTEEYRDIARQRLEQLMSKETTVDFIEQKVILNNGDIIDVESGSSSFKHGKDRYIVSVIRDITERKKAEDLQKKIIEKNLLIKEVKEYDRLKTEFFSTISHELKTPLNIILGGLQLLISFQGDCSDCEYSPKFKKYTHMMKQNCYRLLRLINNIIDITKIDSGYMKVKFENHNIVKVIEDITQSVSQYINYNGIEVIFDTNVEEKFIACDVEKLERIMLNLLSNAVKFTDSGGKIEVTITNKGNIIEISVKDTGIGIPEEMILEIFERFRQVDSSLRRKKEGSGIGLSLVKSILVLHGGDIRVNSEVGKGSEFIFTLPANSCKDLEGAEQEIAATTPTNVERIQVEFSDIYS